MDFEGGLAGGAARCRPGIAGRMGVGLVLPGGGRCAVLNCGARPSRRSPGITIMGRDARVPCCLVAGLRPNEDLGTLRPDLDALCERRAAAGRSAFMPSGALT